MPWGSSGLKKSQTWRQCKNPRRSALRENISGSRPMSEGGSQRLGRKDVSNCLTKMTIIYGEHY
jgi:hypothetical protein